ncbi:MAG TPA: RNA polymerase sigma factor [Gammaproteobacteria bacterium]|nr:RNA polymerase sigma factor [Gammaproteobacteria bacterium]
MSRSSALDTSHQFATFQQALVRMLPRLRGLALSYCGSLADAEDTVQQTCERALKSWRQWRGAGELEHWLLKILVNAWRDERRYRQLRSPDGAAPQETAVDNGTDAETEAYLDQVRAEILRLPSAQREVLLLVAGEGLSYKEAAFTLGVPIGTVMSRLARARQTLVEALGDLDEGND